MSIKEKAYQVWYEVEIDNGYEYMTDVRYNSFDNHLEAIQLADRLWEEGEVNNIVVKHYGWDFYVPGGKEYVIRMLDLVEQDEVPASEPMPFLEALCKLIKLQWNNKFDWVVYKLEYYTRPAEPVCPSAPDNWIPQDELPF